MSQSIPIVNKLNGFPIFGQPSSTKINLQFNFSLKRFEYIESAELPHGEIFLDTPGAGQIVGTTFTKINQFNQNGAKRNMIVDQANNKITSLIKSDYAVACHISLIGGNNRVYTLAAFVDGVEQPNVRTQDKNGTGTDVDNIGFSGIVSAEINDDIDIRIKQDAGSDLTTIIEGNITVIFI